MTVATENLSYVRNALRRSLPAVFAFIAFLMLCAFGTTVQAVVVGTTNTTNINPLDYVPPPPLPGQPNPDWIAGDPGWNNVSQSGSNFVYLGDNWVLTARHIGAATATFSTGSFPLVPGQDLNGKLVVGNPPASLANGVALTAQTDLRLFRISGNVNLPALTIASESPSLTGASGSEMMFISNGRIRWNSETHWSMNTSSPPSNWATAEVPTGGNVHGYQTSDTRTKRWGTNRLEDPSSNLFNNDTFDEILSGTTAVMPLTTSDGQTRDVISMVTKFDQQGTNGALPFESQAVSSDSGSAVFYNRGTELEPDWVLSGIVNATIIYGNQPRTYAVYGNSTTFTDLSYYNQGYKSSICDIMKACESYSIMGDVNLDGDVTGDGSGLATEDDVAAFVEGWGTGNLAGKGDYETWKKGDLNLDGMTDVEDFLMLRGALNGPIASSAMQTLFGAVPEPSSAILAILAMAFLAAKTRRRAGY